MYLGKAEIKDIDSYEKLRKMDLVDKAGAVDVAFSELGGLINKTQFADQYFNRTHAWLSQKLNGCTVMDRKKSFNEKEFHQMAEAFRHIAKRLSAHADEIDAAPLEAAED